MKTFKQYLLEYVSNNIIYFKKYLNMSDDDKGKELAILAYYNFPEFVMTEYNKKIEDFNDPYEFEKNFPNYFDKYGKFLYDMSIGNGGRGINMSDYLTDDMLPAWVYFNDPKIFKTGWVIHFTNSSVHDIAKEGFYSGIQGYENLGLSDYAYKTEGERGYSFAFDVNEFQKFAMDKWDRSSFKYCKQCVVLRTSGIKTWHNGDEEPQVIFWDEDAKDIVPIYETNGTYGVEELNSERIIYQDEDLNKVVEWIIANFDQYHKVISRY